MRNNDNIAAEDDGDIDDLESESQRLLLNHDDSRSRSALSWWIESTASLENNINPALFCVFIAKFDLKKGNIIEYVYPPMRQSAVAGIEFKAIASGFHKLTSDYVFFQHKPTTTTTTNANNGGGGGGSSTLYGLSCFHNLRLDNNNNNNNKGLLERGARMRCAGVLLYDPLAVAYHYEFLSEQVRRINEHPTLNDQVTADLRGFYHKFQQQQQQQQEASTTSTFPCYCLSNNNNNSSSNNNNNNESNEMMVTMTMMRETHPFKPVQLLHHFGPNLFLVWKSLLLQKRILFYSPVPLGVACSRVHGCRYLLKCSNKSSRSSSSSSSSAMGLGTGDGGDGGDNDNDRLIREPVWLYYVNLTDMHTTLTHEPFYIACTSEKIFEMKTDCYDVYVDDQNFILNKNKKKQQQQQRREHKRDADDDDDEEHDEDLSKIIKLTKTDTALYRRLERLLAAVDPDNEQENAFTRFFSELNANVFGTLTKYHHDDDGGQLILSRVNYANPDLPCFDPSDVEFVQRLCALYEFDIVVVKKKQFASACGPCCC